MRHTVFICSLVNIQQVTAQQRVFINGITHVNVRQAIVINVDDGYPSAPPAHAANTRFFGDVLKLKVAPIYIELIAYAIACKVNILQPVVVKIANSYATAVVN